MEVDAAPAAGPLVADSKAAASAGRSEGTTGTAAGAAAMSAEPAAADSPNGAADAEMEGFNGMPLSKSQMKKRAKRAAQLAKKAEAKGAREEGAGSA